MCLHGALRPFPFNLTCNMTIFRGNRPFDPIPGIEGVSTDKIVATMMLYASFTLI